MKSRNPREQHFRVPPRKSVPRPAQRIIHIDTMTVPADPLLLAQSLRRRRSAADLKIIAAEIAKGVL